MESSSTVLDKKFEKWSLNWALAFLIIMTVLLSVGVLGTIKYLKSGDDVGAFLDIANTFIGGVGIILGCRIIQTVVRRLVSESPR